MSDYNDQRIKEICGALDAEGPEGLGPHVLLALNAILDRVYEDGRKQGEDPDREDDPEPPEGDDCRD